MSPEPQAPSVMMDRSATAEVPEAPAAPAASAETLAASAGTPAASAEAVAASAEAVAEAERLAARIGELGPDALSPDAVRTLMTAAITAFGRHVDAGTPVPEPADATKVNATDAVRAASAVLKAVNLETFELALWETWGGTPWRTR